LFDEISDTTFAGLRVDADDRLGGLTEAIMIHNTSNLHLYCLLDQTRYPSLPAWSAVSSQDSPLSTLAKPRHLFRLILLANSDLDIRAQNLQCVFKTPTDQWVTAPAALHHSLSLICIMCASGCRTSHSTAYVDTGHFERCVYVVFFMTASTP